MHAEAVRELAVRNRAIPQGESREIFIGLKGPHGVPGNLSSFLIGGATNQGKSVIGAFLAGYAVGVGGCRLMVIDPHRRNTARGLLQKIEPLTSWFALPPVDVRDVDALVGQFDWLEDTYARREQDMTDAFPLLLLIDEANELFGDRRLSKGQRAAITQTIANIARGGSKHNMFVGILLHNSDVTKAGGSEIRYNVSSRIALHCESREQVKILDYDDRRRIEELTAPMLRKGSALVRWDGHPLCVLRYPLVTRQWCEAVAGFTRDLEHDISESGESAESGTEHPESLTLELTHLTPDHKTAESGLPEPNRYMEQEQDRDGSGLARHLTNLTRVSREDFEAVVAIGNRMIREHGCVYRKKIQKELGWNSYRYKIIEQICNELGWSNKMAGPKELSTPEKQLMRTQAGRCACCGSTEDLEIDHIWPRSLGGPTREDNLQVLCKECNRKKGGSTKRDVTLTE